MRILITAGPTREYFDSVRFISNPSSGRMGFALAEAAARKGHAVTLVAGPVEIDPPRRITTIPVISAEQMFRASVTAFANCEAAIMTAAVCDYRPARALKKKLKKAAEPRVVKLLPTKDIAAYLGRIKKNRVVIGFAMEDHDEHRHARRKLVKKKCDAIVLNGHANIGANRATIEILRSDTGWSGPYAGSKQQIADRVLKLAEEIAELKLQEGIELLK